MHGRFVNPKAMGKAEAAKNGPLKDGVAADVSCPEDVNLTFEAPVNYRVINIYNPVFSKFSLYSFWM